MYKQFSIYEKVDYYKRLIDDPNKSIVQKNFYKQRIRELTNSKEYSIGGMIGHNSDKKYQHAKKNGWKPNTHYEGT